MSDKPISVGDLVMVLKDVCCDKRAGLPTRVVGFREGKVDCVCGRVHKGYFAELSFKSPRRPWVGNYPKNLKRIPPLEELDDVKKDEEITA